MIRVDRFAAEPELQITVKEIVRSRALAEAEVERLNRLVDDEQCRYFWQMTRLYPPGTSASTTER